MFSTLHKNVLSQQNYVLVLYVAGFICDDLIVILSIDHRQELHILYSDTKSFKLPDNDVGRSPFFQWQK